MKFKKSFYFLTIVAVCGSLVIEGSFLKADSEEILKKDHKKFYRVGSQMEVSKILELKEFPGRTLKSITVTYNMVRSELEADWICNGNVVAHSELPKGMLKKVSYEYNQQLPADIRVKFTGTSGQVQVRSIEAVVSAAGEALSLTIAKVDTFDQKMSQIIIDPSIKKEKDIRLAQKIRRTLASSSDMKWDADKDKLQIQVSDGKVIISGQINEEEVPKIRKKITSVIGVRSVRVSQLKLIGMLFSLPDLIVEDISVEPSIPEIYQNVKVQVRIRNKGKTRVHAEGKLIYARPRSEQEVLGGYGEAVIGGGLYVEPGETVTQTFEPPYYSIRWKEPGTKTLTFIADNENKYPEKDETNNSFTKQIEVEGELPDLEVVDIDVEPVKPLIYKTAIVKVRIRNNGGKNIHAEGKLIYARPRSEQEVLGGYGEAVIGGGLYVEPGETVTQTFEPPYYSIRWKEPGTKTLTFIADNENKYPEKDETNNSFTKQIEVEGELPDLMVEDIIIEPAQPFVDALVVIKVKLKNLGGTSIHAEGKLIYDRPETTNESLTGYGQAYCGGGLYVHPGETVTQVFEPPYYEIRFRRPGEKNIIFIADMDDKYPEKDESNNRLTKTIQVMERQ